MFGLGKKSPAAREVAMRALALREIAICGLSMPPQDMRAEFRKQWPPQEWKKFEDEASAMAQQRWRRLKELGVQLTPREKELSTISPVAMTAQQQINATWRVEALVMLLWALKATDAPPMDVQVEPEKLMPSWPPSPFEAYLKSASLRPQGEIEAARSLAELWHWRSRTRQLIEQGADWPAALSKPEAGITSYDGVVRQTAKAALAAGDLPSVIDEDFPAFGKAYRDIDGSQYSLITSITMERHFALNWLCGRAPGNRWDETPTDT